MLSGDLIRAIENADHARNGLESLVTPNPQNSTAAKYLALVYSRWANAVR